VIGCKEVMQELSNFLEGTLDEDFKRDLRSHLTNCQHCQVVVDTTRKTIELYCDGELFHFPRRCAIACTKSSGKSFRENVRRNPRTPLQIGGADRVCHPESLTSISRFPPDQSTR